jgi:hypothetical protein
MRYGIKGHLQLAETLTGYTESDTEDADFVGILTSISILTDGTNDVKIDIYNTGALTDKSNAKMVYSKEVPAAELSDYDNFIPPLYIEGASASPGYSVEITTSGGAGCGYIVNGVAQSFSL